MSGTAKRHWSRIEAVLEVARLFQQPEFFAPMPGAANTPTLPVRHAQHHNPTGKPQQRATTRCALAANQGRAL